MDRQRVRQTEDIIILVSSCTRFTLFAQPYFRCNKINRPESYVDVSVSVVVVTSSENKKQISNQ